MLAVNLHLTDKDALNNLLVFYLIEIISKVTI